MSRNPNASGSRFGKLELGVILLIVGAVLSLVGLGMRLAAGDGLGLARDYKAEAEASMETATEALEKAQMFEDQALGLQKQLDELTSGEESSTVEALIEEIEALGGTVTIDGASVDVTIPVVVQPLAPLSAPESPMQTSVTSKADKIAAYQATQARLTPATPMTWPTTPFATKAACDAHYKARMTYWLKKYGVYDAHYLAHCMNIIWGESKGDCNIRNDSDHVGLAQFSTDWWTTGSDWRTNGDTSLRRLAKAIAEGGHANLEQHWNQTMGRCV